MSADGKIYNRVQISERTKVYSHAESYIGSMCFISVRELHMAKGSHIDAGCKLIGRGRVYMGKYSVLGYDVKVLTSTDRPSANMSDYVPEDFRDILTGDVYIGDHAFVATNAVILPGVTIDEGAFVGIGTVVKENVPAWTRTYADGRTGKREMKKPLWEGEEMD